MPDAQIIKAPTVLLGTGEAISGRIILTLILAQLKILFFMAQKPINWMAVISSKVGEEVTLVYAKNGRFATIYLSPKETCSRFYDWRLWK